MKILSNKVQNHEETSEAERLSTLRMYNLLDTSAEAAFDDLVLLAAQVCNMPISLISLLDEHRQWFKAKTGIERSETPREWAFCDHAIQQNDIFVVNDATSDDRFSSNPLVTEAPHIRFYAGIPLEVENGSRLGTLCVIGHAPAELSKPQLKALATIRAAVVNLIELRRSAMLIAQMESLLSVCAWCRSVKQNDGSWQTANEFVEKNSRVSHGICSTCYENVKDGRKNS